MARSQDAGLVRSCLAPAIKSNLASEELLEGGLGGLEGKYMTEQKNMKRAGAQSTNMYVLISFLSLSLSK